MAAQYIAKFIKDNLDTVIQSVTGGLKQLIDDVINNLDFQALFNTVLRKATDVHTFVDFEPGLGPQDRSPGASPRGGMGEEFEDARQEPPGPAWQKYVAILNEVDNQYPDELKYVSWGVIWISCFCALGLLIIQSWDTRW